MDLVVIGGGTSGFMVANGAAKLGLKVTLVESSNLIGGSSLYNSCVPSKTLLHIAHTLYDIKNASKLGIHVSGAEISMDEVRSYIDETISKIQQEYNIASNGCHNLTVHKGAKVRFYDKNSLEVDGELLSPKNIVIATGSRPLIPNIRGLEQLAFLDNESIFKLTELPKRLAIIGSKPAAIEFAQAFNRLGSQVFVIDHAEHILMHEDPELVWQLKAQLEQEGIKFITNTQVTEVYVQNQQKVLNCEDFEGETFNIQVNELLVAMGRTPNLEGLNLDAAEIKYNDYGILVSSRLRTTNKKIYAIGDVVFGLNKSTSAAEYQANIVLANVAYKIPTRIADTKFPYVIFTDPEYAQVGLTESQAIEQGYKNLSILRYSFKNLDAANVCAKPRGLIKVIVEKDKIIGASILGVAASTLIAEWGLAIKVGASINDIASTLYAYPSISQINKKVAMQYYKHHTDTFDKKSFSSFMQKVFGSAYYIATKKTTN